MATGVEELVDMLFAMIDEAKSVPLSSEKCIIERDRALDLLDDIKAQFPMEFGEAKKLLAARADYIASAKREADPIRKAAEDRARRRHAELAAKGLPDCYETVLADIIERDRKDTTRAAAPLQQAEDAIAVDTTGLSLQESFDALLETIRRKLGQ